MNIKEKIETNRSLNNQLQSDFNSINAELDQNWPSLKFLLHNIFVTYSGKYYSNNSRTEFKIIKKKSLYIWFPIIVSKGVPVYLNKIIKILIRIFGKKEYRVVLSKGQFDNILIDYERFTTEMRNVDIKIPPLKSIFNTNIYVYNRVISSPLIFIGGSAAHLPVSSALHNYRPKISLGFNHHSKSKNCLNEPVFSIIESYGYKYYLDYREHNQIWYNSKTFKIDNYDKPEIFYIPTSIGHYQYGPYRNLDNKDYLDWQIFLLKHLTKFQIPVTVIKHPKGVGINYGEYVSDLCETVGLDGILPGGRAIVVVDYMSSVLSQLMNNKINYVFLDIHSRKPTAEYLQKVKRSGDYLDVSTMSEEFLELDELIYSRINV